MAKRNSANRDFGFVRPVVCNSSPLIGLEQIGKLSLLRELFGAIAVPPAVVTEVAPSVSLPRWIEQRALSQNIGPLILEASLGRGESEAISLALELDALLMILDDRPARRLAQSLSLPVVGTLGILLLAKRKHLLPALKPCLEELSRFDFRIAPALYEQVLEAAGESL